MRQFITNEEGERTAVVLPIGEYEELMERLEDAEALKEADVALTAIERGKEDVLRSTRPCARWRGSAGAFARPTSSWSRGALYEVLLPRRVRKGMSRSARKDFDRVLATIQNLAEDRRPCGVKDARYGGPGGLAPLVQGDADRLLRGSGLARRGPGVRARGGFRPAGDRARGLRAEGGHPGGAGAL